MLQVSRHPDCPADGTVKVYQKGDGPERKYVITGDFEEGYMQPTLHVERPSFYLNPDGKLEAELRVGAVLVIMSHSSPQGFQVSSFESGEAPLAGWHDRLIFRSLEEGTGFHLVKEEQL